MPDSLTPAPTDPGVAPVGAVLDFAGSVAPTGWLVCDGTAVPRAGYPVLFQTIGTIYGAGDGSTTFNLPDLRGRVTVGLDAGTFQPLGKAGGAETHQLSLSEIPAHKHTPEGGGFFMRSGGVSGVGPGAGKPNIDGLDDETAAAGGNGHHNNLQPYRALNKIIRAA